MIQKPQESDMTLEVEDDVAGETKTREKLLFPYYR